MGEIPGSRGVNRDGVGLAYSIASPPVACIAPYSAARKRIWMTAISRNRKFIITHPTLLRANTPSAPKSMPLPFSRKQVSDIPRYATLADKPPTLPAHRRKSRLLPRIVDIASVPIEYTGYRPGEEGQREAFDNTKARRELGYGPKASAEETVRLTAEWVKSLVRAG